MQRSTSPKPTKVYRFCRKKDGKFHKGTTAFDAFSRYGKLYTVANAITCAIEWWWYGDAGRNEEGMPVVASRTFSSRRALFDFEVVEYEMVEVRRVPAHEWMMKRSTPYKRAHRTNP